MTAGLAQLVEDYLGIRRSLGYKLEDNERLLARFLEYLTAAGSDAVTVENALGFATAKTGASRRRQALRLSAVRGFARWAHTVDPTIQVPPARLLPARPTRAAPYIYTAAEITALLTAAGRLRPAIRAATFTALVALMAATGIRTGEAMSLNIADFDQRSATLTVTGKYGKVRMLPVHPTVADGLAGYLRQRERLLPAGDCPALLVSSTGLRLYPTVVYPTFHALLEQAGLAAVSPTCRPRLYDLRHTFAVSTMLDAYRGGADPAVILALLSTWLGHAEPGDTYWYLSGTAELLAAATARLESHRGHDGTGPS